MGNFVWNPHIDFYSALPIVQRTGRELCTIIHKCDEGRQKWWTSTTLTWQLSFSTYRRSPQITNSQAPRWEAPATHSTVTVNYLSLRAVGSLAVGLVVVVVELSQLTQQPLKSLGVLVRKKSLISYCPCWISSKLLSPRTSHVNGRLWQTRLAENVGAVIPVELSAAVILRQSSRRSVWETTQTNRLHFPMTGFFVVAVGKSCA